MYINADETMSLMCVKSRTQLYRLINKGVITAYKPSGRLLFDRDEIIKAIEESRVQPQLETVSNTVSKTRKKKKGYEPYDGSRDWLKRQMEATA